MTSIITETSGGRTRRCDANCHHAKGTICRCICGGRYHGRGRRARGLLLKDMERGAFGGQLQNAAMTVDAVRKRNRQQQCLPFEEA